MTGGLRLGGPATSPQPGDAQAASGGRRNIPLDTLMRAAGGSMLPKAARRLRERKEPRAPKVPRRRAKPMAGMAETEDLEALVAVLSHAGRFDLAARLLGISQPAVSRRIQNLERALGFPLFVRARRGSVMAMTEQGVAYAAMARAHIEGLQAMVQAVGAHAVGLSRNGRR